MYEYIILSSTKYRVIGYYYNSIFTGSEDEAIAIVDKLNEAHRITSMLNAKNKVELLLDTMAENTITLTNKKYRLTDAMGLTGIIRDEFARWKLDRNSPTPTIDGWAIDKGKTREAQLESVGFVILFTEKSSKIQELAWSKLGVASVMEQVTEIENALLEIKNCDSVPCVLGIADVVLGELRNV